MKIIKTVGFFAEVQRRRVCALGEGISHHDWPNRPACRDIVRLYSTSTWESLGEFTAETLDLCNLEWSPDGSALCLQDTSLE